MNKIYKIVKSHHTGNSVVVSELAKRAGKVTSLVLLFAIGTSSASSAFAASLPGSFNPEDNDNGAGQSYVSGAGQIIDLNTGAGFGGAQKGKEVTPHTISAEDSFSNLYQIKYADVKTAYNNLTTAQNEHRPADEIAAYQQAYDDAVTHSQSIADDKFKVSDPNNLIGQNTEGTVISQKDIKYKDVVTGKTFEITVVNNLVTTLAGSGIGNSGMSFNFYEKMPAENQYDAMNMVQVDGATSDLTIINSGNQSDNETLNAIAKNGSGVILINDGANLTYDTQTSYYLGSGKSTSTPFIDQENYTLSNTQQLYKVTFKGEVNTILGVRNIDSVEAFNAFNKELISFIQTNQQIRLDYSNVDAMQAFYQQQISNLYSNSSLGEFSYTYNLTHDELEQLAAKQGLATEFADRVTNEDIGSDIGLDSSSKNYFIGVTGNGSVVTLTENAQIKNATSEGTSLGSVIKADYDTSGLTANNKFIINGEIDASGGSAISAKNAEILIGASGVIKGNISATGTGANNGASPNSVENHGLISGTATVDNGKITNYGGATLGGAAGNQVEVINESGALITGSVNVGDNSTVTNDATIMGSITAGKNAEINNHDGALVNGWVTAQEGSTVINDSDAVINGTVVVNGNNASFTNNGVAGGTHAANGANSTNNNLIIGGGDGIVNLDSNSTFTNNGDIYVGYVNNNGVAEVGSAAGKYNAMTLSGTAELVNNKNIYVAGNQHDVVVVNIGDHAQYSDTVTSKLIINQENNPISGVDSDKGSNNIAVLASGSGTKATIQGLIVLNDAGSTALQALDGGHINLTGSVELNSQNIETTQIRSFGAWIEGEGSTLTMSGDAVINMNADRAIGVHIRDGATANIGKDAGITFSDKENQIGFLVSGIEKASSIIYDSAKTLELNGKGSVLFRVERGSLFDSNTVSDSLSLLSSNQTEDSTLIVITNGPVATGASNQTKANLDGFSLTVDGNNAKGISVEGGAQTIITDKTAIQLSGDSATLAKVDGWYYDLNGVHQVGSDGSSLLTSSAHLSSDSNVSAENAVGYYLTHGGKLTHQGTIDFLEPSKNNIGVKIDSGGMLVSENNSSIKVHGTAVEISGSNSLATINNSGLGSDPVVWAVGQTDNDSAYHVKDQASLLLTGKGITKAEGTAHGILVDGASKITLSGSTIDLYGNNQASSSGNGIENRSSLQAIEFTDNAKINVLDGIGIHSSIGFAQAAQTSGVINVYGQGSGIRFEQIDPMTGAILGSTDHAIVNTGYENVVVNVFDKAGYGVWVDSTQAVTTSTSVNIISDTGNSALVIKGTSETALQSGRLHSANQDRVLVDLNNGSLNTFTNNGELLFGSFSTDGNYTFSADNTSAAQAVATADSENKLHFINAGKGQINGVVELLGHTGSEGNTVELQSGSIGHIFTTGQGDDLFNISTIKGLDNDGVKKQFDQIFGGDGYDKLIFGQGSDYTINQADTINGIEYIDINQSKLTINQLADLTTGTQTYALSDPSSYLIYNMGAEVNFDRQLLGSGTFIVDLSDGSTTDHRFAFTEGKNQGDFVGTAELKNAQMDLDKINTENTQALTNATLKASENSQILVGNGTQHIGGLNFNGGTVDFGVTYLDDGLADNNVAVNSLHLGSGSVRLDITGSPTGIPTHLSILEQDDDMMGTQLVASQTAVTGNVADIALRDQDNNLIPDPTKLFIKQNGENVARGSYGTALTTGSNNDGLYVGFGLTQVELLATGANALMLDATGKSGLAAELTAKLTDFVNDDSSTVAGDLQIVGSGNVTLNNQNNDYHGATYLKETSTLTAGSNTALGQTRELNLAGGTRFDLNGKQQTIGALISAANSQTDLNEGSLTVAGAAASTSYGRLTGGGALIVSQNNLSIFGANQDLSAQVTIEQPATINSWALDSLGSGEIITDGTLNLTLNQLDGSLTNRILTGSRSGVVNKAGNGSLTMQAAQAQYQGTTNINQGTLVFTNDLSSANDTVQSQQINVASGANLVGMNSVVLAGRVNNSGHFYVGMMPQSQIVDSSTVTVGQYHGEPGSTLYFNGTLAGDNSPINRLLVTGDSSGSSQVAVKNIGGLGAQTVEGIEIINIAGDSDAVFTKAGRIISGAYDYDLVKKGHNWYLQSEESMRPEGGSYLANLTMANSLFNLRLHDRLGETQYTDRLTGEQKVTSMWMRHQYGYTKFSAGNESLDVKNNWNISQLGGDIAQWSSNDLNRLHLGVMAGYGHSSSKTHADLSGNRSTGSLSGYSAGVYATWYDNDQDKTGLYIDGWAQWNSFKGEVSGDQMSVPSYRLKGLTASVESGYSFLAGQTENYDIWLQPKAQVTWMGVRAQDVNEDNGTHIRGYGDNVQTRLGLRSSIISNAALMGQTDQAGQLFIEANWLYNSKTFAIDMDDRHVRQDGARNIAELKVGVEGNIYKNTNVWFNVAGQRGDHDYSNASALVGLKYSF